ncbi:uncharacterized protein [Lolium perenne]|uniref:uncharacterized protein isoform X1 n=1 Tax=Lolium perenne TaxID=4522 RepID=UPI003A993B94
MEGKESSRGRFGDLLAIMLAGITWRLISSRKYLWNIYLHNFTCLCLLRSFKALPHSEFEASLEGLLGFVAPNSINCRSPPATLAGRDQAVLAQAWCFP